MHKKPQKLGLILVLAYGLGFALAVSAAQFPCRARVTGIQDLSHDTKLIRFRLVEAQAFQFTPGQYGFMKVPDDYVKEWNTRYGTSHGEVSRAYSFASSPSHLPEFDLIIKLAPAPPGKDVPPGLASTFVHTRLKTGDVIEFSRPAGSLYLGSDEGRPILIVAGGTGAAPFVGLLEYWFENQLHRKSDIHFFFGVRGKRDLFLDEQFRKWAKENKNFHYIPALSDPRPEDQWKGETGYVNLVVEKHINAPSDADAYLAGPPLMLRESMKVLTAKGIPKERIHYDAIAVK